MVKKLLIVMLFSASFFAILPTKALPVERLSKEEMRVRLPSGYENWSHKVSETCAINDQVSLGVSAFGKVYKDETQQKVFVEMLIVLKAGKDSIGYEETGISYLKGAGNDHGEWVEGYGAVATDNGWVVFNILNRNENRKLEALADEIFIRRFGMIDVEARRSGICSVLQNTLDKFGEEIDEEVSKKTR